MSLRSFGIIGLGKLGLSIAVGLSTQGRLAWAMNRGLEQRNAAKFVLSPSLPMYSSIDALPDPPSSIILAVSDSAIEEVSGQLAEKFGKKLSDIVVIHCSGAKTRSALVACEECGAFTLSLHPYQTFGIATTKNFKDIAWGAEFPPNEPFRTISEQFAHDMIQALGGKMMLLSPMTIENKPIYHASAVFASNYMNVLVGFAAEAARLAGIAPEQFLPQILTKSLENAMAGLKQPSGKYPLTGPISRGDLATLESHLASFRSVPNGHSVMRPYCLLGMTTAEFAHSQGMITAEQKAAIVSLLEKELQS
jgi:predicted short-subunit dehydrogenase-like oxidoreductase (DUF2520 family)